MAQREVSGTDILLFISEDAGENYNTIVCLTSNSLTGSTDTINSSSKCGTSSSPGPTTNDVNFDGNYMVDPDSGKISGGRLFTLWKNKTNFSWKMGPAIPVDGDDVYSSTGFINTITITYPDGVATFSGTISADDITLTTTGES